MPECQECGSFVTQKFVLVFGVDGEVAGCQECQSTNDIRGYAGLNK